MSKYELRRLDLNLDPVVIETEGLTIGRLLGNDLCLNHPTVSRTHAGIRNIEGDYWIFNLSEANGTLLNGQPIDQTPLADGDVLQIGPFFLQVRYGADVLHLEIELTVNPLPTEPPGTGEMQATMILEPGQLLQLQRAGKGTGGTRRLSATGLLTGILSPGDAQALKIFWEKRKREAGKLTARSPLRPQRGGLRPGKAQFNWVPTRDLEQPWPVSLFVWGSAVVGLLAVMAIFFRTSAYSPGELSLAHDRRDLATMPAVATRANAGSCTTCHTATGAIETNCASCHTTPAFDSGVSAVHQKAGIGCIQCHSEHQGGGFRPALTANSACTICHRAGSGVVSALNGMPLGTPHGGSFGYPVSTGLWNWEGISEREWTRRDLPGSPSQFTSKEQFHLIHLGGRQQGRSQCTDCHVAGLTGESLTQGVRQSCAACHGTSPGESVAESLVPASNSAGSAEVSPGPRCVSCHSQHGEHKDLRASLRRQ